MVIYAHADGGFSVWDPARNYWKEQDTGKPDRPPAFRFKPEEVWDGLPRESPEKLCNGLILDWGSWQRENGDAYMVSSPASMLAKVEEIPDSVVPRRIRPEDPGRPIDARLVPVKIALAESTPLKLGQRVEIEILADEHR